MVFIYDILFILFSLLYLPYLLLKRKWHAKMGMRFGFFKKEALGLADKKRVWIHAVSVGEVMVIRNLIKKIKTAYPTYQIVVSVVTPTGFELAKTVMSDGDTVIFAPVDLSFAVRKYVRLIDPVLYLNAETELWPNFLTALHARNIPIIQVNGRISDSAFKGYKFFRFFFKRILSYVTYFCMQGELDKKRIEAMGAPEEKVYAVGNMKFDDVSTADVHGLPPVLTHSNETIFIAGSTHPGEEEIILDVARSIERQFPYLRLILAPRHPERASEIMRLCTQKGFTAVKFSQIKDVLNEEVVVVDTIGHLRSLFSLGDVVFLGKSLTVKGGHNIVEPGCFGKPIVIGPFMENFRDITKIFLENDAVIQVKDKSELQTAVVRLLQDKALRARLGNNARNAVEKYRGATEKTFEVVSSVLGRAA